MADHPNLRRAALRAALAVTFGVGSLAAGACTEEDPTEPGEDVVPVDAQSDGTTTTTTTTTSPDAAVDTSAMCSITEDGVCPSMCSASDDFDCCEMSGGSFAPGGGCGVPGPFTPPTVRV